MAVIHLYYVDAIYHTKVNKLYYQKKKKHQLNVKKEIKANKYNKLTKHLKAINLYL